MACGGGTGTYAHATALLRRLADRYVIRAVLSVMLGQPVEEQVSAALEKLPAVMARAGQIERAVVDRRNGIAVAPAGRDIRRSGDRHGRTRVAYSATRCARGCADHRQRPGAGQRA